MTFTAHSHFPNWFLILSSIGACFWFMWPRLLDAHFGLLDDGVILLTAQAILERPVTAFTVGTEHGRFFPAFWLFNTAVYGVVGQNPAGFFAANLVILIGITITLALAVRAAGGTDLQAMLAAVCFLIGAPVVEAFYTLSKPEPLQALLLVTSIYLAVGGAHARTETGRWLSAAGAVVSLLTASFLKETTIILLPIVVGWTLIAWFTGSWVAAERRRSLVVLLVAGGVAVTAFVAIRALFLPAAQVSGSYASNFIVTPGRIALSGARWAGWLLHDFSHLFVLALFVAPSIRDTARPARELLVGSTVWMAGWIAMYLPWHSLLQYYLLPFSLGAAVFTAVALSILIGRVHDRLPSRRWLARLGLVVTVGVLGANIVNNMTQAAIQLILDRTNAYLVDYLATLPPGTTVLVNVDEPNEYEFEIGVHLGALRARGDMKVDYFRPTGSATAPDGNATRVVATPILTNQIAPSVRMAVWEAGAAQRQRLLQGAGGQRDGWSIRSSAQLVDVGFHRLLSILPVGPIALIDSGLRRRFIDRRRFTYGWTVVSAGP